MRIGPAIIGLVTLTACTVTEPTAPIPSTTEDTCDARQYANLIGQDATALEKVLILGQVRVIRPGDAVTQDFRPERINFGIDTANRISDISCG
ncbi:I78 family peptidase inhibitor [Yoonia sp. 2307UL14-13]|uniref:I78 family peptidase inhibitor n=1 Tax=Yoonia sp. 2307UL14-13 TaxID=3126506 RepID=UPI0030951A98